MEQNWFQFNLFVFETRVTTNSIGWNEGKRPTFIGLNQAGRWLTVAIRIIKKASEVSAKQETLKTNGQQKMKR